MRVATLHARGRDALLPRRRLPGRQRLLCVEQHFPCLAQLEPAGAEASQHQRLLAPVDGVVIAEGHGARLQHVTYRPSRSVTL